MIWDTGSTISPLSGLSAHQHGWEVALDRKAQRPRSGPGTALSGFMRRIDKSAQVHNVADVLSLEDTVKALGA